MTEWGDLMKNLLAILSGKPASVWAFEARKNCAVSCRGLSHRCELGLKQNRSGRYTAASLKRPELQSVGATAASKLILLTAVGRFHRPQLGKCRFYRRSCTRPHDSELRFGAEEAIDAI